MVNLSQRKSIRLKNYNYSADGFYFITICTQNRRYLFGDIVGVGRDRPEMFLNDIGKIVENIWESLPNHHCVGLDTFQIMPNHVHFIIQITVRATRGSPVIETGGSRPITGGSRPAPTTMLGTIVGLFKSECTKQIRHKLKNPHLVVWQRNYYEHIIRIETDLNKIRQYIQKNPQMWDRDRNNLKNFTV